jgi:hypothetical protein
MVFKNMMKDNIQLLKADGTESNEMKASVQDGKIYLMKSDILIESGDFIKRKMSNGGIETFEVITPGFYEGIQSIPAHYQMKVKKLGMPEAEKAIQSITYNISGSNARVNNNSTDNSYNIINNDLVSKIEDLRTELNNNNNNLSNKVKEESLEIVVAVEEECKKEKPNKVVVRSLVRSLPAIESITTIGASIVSMLN